MMKKCDAGVRQIRRPSGPMVLYSLATRCYSRRRSSSDGRRAVACPVRATMILSHAGYLPD